MSAWAEVLAQANLFIGAGLTRAERIEHECIDELLITLHLIVAFERVEHGVGAELTVKEECSLAFLPIEQDVDFVPAICLVVNRRIDELVHLDLIAEAKSEEDWRLQSFASSFVLFELCVIALEAWCCWHAWLS